MPELGLTATQLLLVAAGLVGFALWMRVCRWAADADDRRALERESEQ